MYSYQTQRERLFTDEGQRMFTAVRDNVRRLLKAAGAVRMQEAIQGCGGDDSWDMLACLDRMVELGDIREVTRDIFTAANSESAWLK